MRSRKRIFDRRSRARWLNQKLQKEKQLQFKLSNRKCKLQKSLSFLKDNFECSEKIHQNSISEIRRTTLPTLQKETRDMQRRSDSETVMLAHTKNMLQVYENRRNKLLEQEDKLKTDIKVAEIEKSRLIKRQSDNEIVMAQMESDVRSASIYFKKVSEEPRRNQMVVNSLQGLMKDSKQWLSRADRDIRYLSRLSTKMTKFLHRLQYFKISSSKCESLIKRELRAITNVVSDELFHRRVSAIIKESSIPIDIPTKEFDELRDMSATGLDRFQKTSETGEVLKDRFRRAEAQLDRRNESQTNLSDVYDDFEELRGARSLSLGSFDPTRRRSSTNLQMNRADNPKIKGNENDSDRK